MKTSLKIVLASLAIGVCGIIFVSTAFRTINKNRQWEQGKVNVEEEVSSTSTLPEGAVFTKLDLNVAGRIFITKGEGFSLKSNLDSDKLKISYKDTSSTLSLALKKINLMKEDEIVIEITMPSLEKLALSGAGQLDLSGFQGTSLVIDISGAGDFKCSDLVYDTLSISNSGAGKLSLKDSQFQDADIELSGAGFIDLKSSLVKNAKVEQSGIGLIKISMDGGKLSGSISGIGSITVYGEVSEKDVHVSGIGKIDYKD